MAKSSTSRRRPRRVISEQGAAPQTTKTDLAVEYAYVIEDLKRIGVLAVVVIGGLIILSFFI